jgi:hypothetical protein
VTLRGFETAVRNVALGSNTPPVDVALTVRRVPTSVTVTATEGKATATAPCQPGAAPRGFTPRITRTGH